MTTRHRSHRERHQERPARRAESLERKRQRLLEAAIGVLRREGPAVSMSEIAHEAGVTKPIVYRAFGDREGLTRAIADRFADELAQSLQRAIEHAPNDRERVSGAIDAYLAFIEREPAIIRFLITRSLETVEESGVATSGFVRRMGHLITQAIGEAMRERGLDSGIAEPWAFSIVGAVHMAGDWWLERRTMPRDQLVECLTSLVWDGMKAYEGSADRDLAKLIDTTKGQM
ncbi:MAG: TetR family transcriptional regulator [Actinomycetota bacterium]